MKPALRTFFVWLLLLALPVQALAAASMLPCVGGVAVAVSAAPHGHGHGHDHAAMLRAMAPRADVHAACAHLDHGRQGGHDARHGGACAACCIGVAPASTLRLPLAFGPPDFIAIPFRAGHVTSVDPPLPERPPRAAFA